MTASLVSRPANPLMPGNYSEAVEFARMLASSDLVPAAYRGKPANILLAMQWGAEVGLGPLQALQNIAVINGRPSIWGDAALALVRGHPACVSVREGVDGEGDQRHGWCEVVRRGEPPHRRTFSVADAKRAGLWGKSGPWQQYPDRMLQMRARGFAIRDVFPDALRGVITAEEAQDLPVGDAIPPPRGPVVDAAPAAAAAEPVSPSVPTMAAARAEDGWPVLAPDGSVVALKPSAWLRGVRRALDRLEDRGAVLAWRREMEVLFGSIAAASADGEASVAEARELIEQRLSELSEADSSYEEVA